jgi:lipopolysaccharide/colanic/teichoic acid biosynthesis glycosyltransferase
MTLKRAFDIVAALLGLIVLSPLFAIVALIIRLQDGSPIFFRQERIGRGGTPFRMWKFRTMVRHAEHLGAPLTVGRDPRITAIGHWLRKLKIDEFPQLINVLKGEMSLVGPRPEVAKYVVMYSPHQQRVLDLIPGITDPSSIRYRNESEFLATSPDPERTYVEIVMPDKIRINLEYAEGASAWSDVVVVLQTIMKIMPGREAETPMPVPVRTHREELTHAA